MFFSSTLAGYVGDDEANASTFDSEGWLKTGDLCYIDQDGFLFVVDRLKELIKYKGYQVYGLIWLLLVLDFRTNAESLPLFED